MRSSQLVLLIFVYSAACDWTSQSFSPIWTVEISSNFPNANYANQLLLNLGTQNWGLMNFAAMIGDTCAISSTMQLTLNVFGNSWNSNTVLYVANTTLGFVLDSSATWNTAASQINTFQAVDYVIDAQAGFTVQLPFSLLSECLNGCNPVLVFKTNASITNSFETADSSLLLAGPTCNSTNCSSQNKGGAYLNSSWGDAWELITCTSGYQLNSTNRCYCSINGTWNCTLGWENACVLTFVGCPDVIIADTVFSNLNIQNPGFYTTQICSPNYVGLGGMFCTSNNTWDISTLFSNCTALPSSIAPVVFQPIIALKNLSFDWYWSFNSSLQLTLLLSSQNSGGGWIPLTTAQCSQTCQIHNYTLAGLHYGSTYGVKICINGTTPLVCSTNYQQLSVRSPQNFIALNITDSSSWLTWDVSHDPAGFFYSLSCGPLFPPTIVHNSSLLTYPSSRIVITCVLCSLGGPNCTNLDFSTSTQAPSIPPTALPTVAPTSTQQSIDNSKLGIALAVTFCILIIPAVGYGVLRWWKSRKADATPHTAIPLLTQVNNTYHDHTVLNSTMDSRMILPGYLLIENFSQTIRTERAIFTGGESIIYACTLLSSDLLQMVQNQRQRHYHTAHAFVFKRYNSKDKEDFEAEIKILGQSLDHSHIMQLAGYVYAPEGPGILTPAYQCNLHDLLHSEQMASYAIFKNQALYTYHALNQMLSAMVFLHAMPMAHCDFKPKNILVELLPHQRPPPSSTISSASMLQALYVDSRNPTNEKNSVPFRLLLADFGLAYCERDDCLKTQGTKGYTLQYAPPERLDGSFKISLSSLQSCDIYAFGVTAAEIMILKQPFCDMNQGDIHSKILLEIKPFDERQLDSGLARMGSRYEMIKTLIDSSLQSDAKKRQSFKQLGKQMSSYLSMNDL